MRFEPWSTLKSYTCRRLAWLVFSLLIENKEQLNEEDQWEAFVAVWFLHAALMRWCTLPGPALALEPMGISVNSHTRHLTETPQSPHTVLTPPHCVCMARVEYKKKSLGCAN